MRLIGSYKNGNMQTFIFSDGTKIRQTQGEEFYPAYSENMDVKITNYCDVGCKFCHEGSCTNGKHGDILNAKFIDTLHPYQELAIGGGDITSHPDLIPFLKKLKDKKVIANITVNQIHFEEKQELIKRLVDEELVYGIGVSLVNPTNEFVKLIKYYPNAVIHVINGILTPSNISALSDKNLKLLILGYKYLRRGEEWYVQDSENITDNQNWLKGNIGNIVKRFNVVSFDNLAIEQLNIRNLLTDGEWDEFYMGDDGTSTFYIDMVERKFAVSSTVPIENRYDLLNSVDNMFKIVTTMK